MNVLHIDSSITGPNSVSRLISAAVITSLKDANPGTQVIHRDLAAEPIPHLDSQALAGIRPAPGAASATTAEAARDTAILKEFLAADTVVIGAPMYNFAIPSQLKAWIDRIAVAGQTFRYTAEGPQGLAGGKKVIVVSSRGGFYAPDTPYAAFDHQESYLRAVFGFIGINDVTFVSAEGVAISPEQRDQAIRTALAAVPMAVAALKPARAA